MTISSFIKRLALSTALAGGLLGAGVTGAHATPASFTWNPSAAIPGADGTFTANNTTVADYATINLANSGAFTENGLVNLSQFTNMGRSVYLPGLDQNYALYVQFTATGQQNASTVAPAPGQTVTGTFNSLTYSLVGASGAPQFSANSSGPSVSGLSNMVTLATGNLISGTSTLTNTPGAGYSANANVLTTFNEVYPSFFIDPPATLAMNFFTSVTNTGSVLQASQNQLIINGGGGNATLQVAAVPEPASFALLGAGLLGLGLITRRRRV